MTTLGGSDKETREPEVNIGSANTAATKGALKSISLPVEEDKEIGRKAENSWGDHIFLNGE